MIKNLSLLAVFLLVISQLSFAQKIKTDANVFGHVRCCDNHIPFATIVVKGTTIGVITDETGHFKLINLPLGKLTIKVSVMGYKTHEKNIISREGETIELNFELEEDVMNLDEVIISANRSEQKRTEAPIIVNTISPAIFNTSQSVTLGEGLNFTPGLRLENNCQNCGFSQVRMNGMEGPYSQILINSKPIFSGLAGVYGLELIPSNMIEKVEVVRGGGSALYGSNAIAGTVNLILKDPIANTYEVGVNYGTLGAATKGAANTASDYQINFNTSIVSDDHKSGVALFGFTRDRGMYDANGDGYSELSPLSNLTVGTRMFHRFGYRDKLSIDFFTIKEERDGGNKQDYPLHERDIAEALKHNLKIAAITFDKFFRESDLISLYVSGQMLVRDSYYGAGKSISDYGNSRDRTYNIGAQYKLFQGNYTIVAGLESTGGYLEDMKLGYPDYDNALINADTITSIPHTDNTIVADQLSITTGAFIQYDLTLERLSLALGARFDNYRIEDRGQEGLDPVKGQVFSPRINLMYKITPEIKARGSYSQGYRAPQIFDEDLHIETSGSRKVIHKNDPDLKQETSHSYMLSVDYNGLIGRASTGLLIEGFYTRLNNPFVNDIGSPDADGVVTYTRLNAEEGAVVQGLNLEFKLKPHADFMLSSGFTLQRSLYDEVHEFGEKHFFRSPNSYGFLAIDWDFARGFCLSTTSNYTGKMLVPYFGTNTNPDVGELRKSDIFTDIGSKLSYTTKLNGASIQFFAGIKNILNSYQSDFDIGIDRDPAYVYGPLSPRTIYFGMRFGNLLK